MKAIVSLMHEGESKLMVLYLDVNFSLVFVIALVDYLGLLLICPPKECAVHFLRVLICESTPMCCCLSPSKATLAFAGLVSFVS